MDLIIKLLLTLNDFCFPHRWPKKVIFFYIILVLVNSTSWLLRVENMDEIDVLFNQRNVGLANFSPNI